MGIHSTIPHIIHQTWKDEYIPIELQAAHQSWQHLHPDWEYQFWTDERGRCLISSHYPWFLATYDAYPMPIMRADALRYFIMDYYGGLYVDLDFICLRALDTLLLNKSLVLGLEPTQHLKSELAKARGLEKIVANAFIASTPRHPFWVSVLHGLLSHHHLPGPLDATGPFFLTKMYDQCPHKNSIHLESADHLYPIHNAQTLSDLPPDHSAYAAHLWHGSWWRPSETDALLKRLNVTVFNQDIKTASLRLTSTLDSPKDPVEKISCLMVTKNRAELAKQAIHCFQIQTYLNKELIILDESLEDTVEQHIQSLDAPNILYTRLPPQNVPLGTLRNMTVQKATGKYIAQWDDDDLYAPERLDMQWFTLHTLQVSACFLQHVIFWWPEKNRVFTSKRRIWEGSMLCIKEKLPIYPALSKGEDTAVVQKLLNHDQVVVMDNTPELYTYLIHGRNTFNEAHFEEHYRLRTTNAC